MPRLAIPILLTLSALARGCTNPATQPTTKPTTQPTTTRIIDFPRRTLTLQPSRDDLTVGAAILLLYTSHPQNISIETAQPMSKSINFIYLKPLAKNQFQLPALTL